MRFSFLLVLSLLSLMATDNLLAENQSEQPNVILFIADDISANDFGCYGNSAARTPVIDQLASSGLRFTNAYLTASSCSPSRSSIITGRYPHNNGAASELHRPLAWHLTQFPARLREAGYYTALSGKHHISQEAPPQGEQAPVEPFDYIEKNPRGPKNRGGHAKWVSALKDRPADKPFFFWFAAFDAHRAWEADKEWHPELYGPKHQPADVIVPPFMVDEESTRQDLASYYNEVTRYDYFIGQVVEELKAQGVYENTLLIVMADNGRPFPRAKTRIHDSGMKTPFVLHWPGGIKQPGKDVRSLVSVIDIAPTVLELAGAKPMESAQGVSFSPMFKDNTAHTRQYVFSEHNWHDYMAHARGVRNQEFLYVINDMTEQAWQGPADSVRSPSHVALQQARDAGKLTPAQADVFQAPRPSEELYLTSSDPHQLTNLVNDPSFASELNKLRMVMQQWKKQTHDSLPEGHTVDGFDRETGDKLPVHKGRKYEGNPPGSNLQADKVNASGPQ